MEVLLMEFMRKVNKRLIAFILVFTIVFTLCGNVSPVYARANIGAEGIALNEEDIDDITKIMRDYIENSAEATQEAILDSKSLKVKSGNWYVVREIDKLPWNVFHNAVQAHIRSKNDNILKHEELIDLYDESKFGELDIFFKGFFSLFNFFF